MHLDRHVPLFQLLAELIGHELEAMEREEERERLLAALERTNGALERRNQELNQFSQIISHDLKAPLRGIASLTTFLEQDAGDRLDEGSRGHLAAMRERVVILQELINALLEFARAGRGSGEITDVDVEALVRGIVDLLAVPSHVGVRIGELGSIRAARPRLHPVFQNLLSNALRFAHSEVRVDRQDTDRGIVFHVSDDGPGVPVEGREKIWEAFETLSYDDDDGGTGVGLAIVKKLVEDLDGSVGVETSEDGGASFFVVLPPVARPPT